MRIGGFGTTFYNLDVQLFPDGSGGILAGWTSTEQASFGMYATRLTSTGSMASGWPAGGVAGYDASDKDVIPDGQGGVFEAFSVLGGSNGDILVRHLLPNSATDWVVSVAATSHYEKFARIAPDDSGGVYVAWIWDYGRLYLQHLRSNGAVVTGWPAAGKIVASTSSGFMTQHPHLAADGSGGVIVTWADFNLHQVLAERFTPAGALAPGWLTGGLSLANLNAFDDYSVLMPSGAGHFIAVWQDDSSGTKQLLLQRFSSSGDLDPDWGDGVVAVRGADANGTFRAVADDQTGAILTWNVNGGPLRGLRIMSNGTFATGWPVGGVQLTSGPTSDWVTAAGSQGGLLIAWNTGPSMQWFLGDGTADPSQPSGGRLLDPTTSGYVRAIMPDGSGGAYVAWDRKDPTYDNGLYLTLSRMTYPTPLAVGPPTLPRSLGLRMLGPNPAHDSFSIGYSLPSDEPARIELLDIAGRRVRYAELGVAREGTARFDHLGSLAPGVYHARLIQSRHAASPRIAIVH